MNSAMPVSSIECIQSRLAEGRIPRDGTVLLLISRSAFILLAQGRARLFVFLLNVPNAAITIRTWWPVYGTLVDIGCLGIMYYLTQREGIRLIDLIGMVKRSSKRTTR